MLCRALSRLQRFWGSRGARRLAGPSARVRWLARRSAPRLAPDRSRLRRRSWFGCGRRRCDRGSCSCRHGDRRSERSGRCPGRRHHYRRSAGQPVGATLGVTLPTTVAVSVGVGVSAVPNTDALSQACAIVRPTSKAAPHALFVHSPVRDRRQNREHLRFTRREARSLRPRQCSPLTNQTSLHRWRSRTRGPTGSASTTTTSTNGSTPCVRSGDGEGDRFTNRGRLWLNRARNASPAVGVAHGSSTPGCTVWLCGAKADITRPRTSNRPQLWRADSSVVCAESG